jgi:hypothetical protein
MVIGRMVIGAASGGMSQCVPNPQRKTRVQKRSRRVEGRRRECHQMMMSPRRAERRVDSGNHMLSSHGRSDQAFVPRRRAANEG